MSGLSVAEVRLLPGCSAGLAEPTALVEISYDTGGYLDSDAEARLRAELPQIWTATPLYRIGPAEWPTGFLVDHSTRDEPAHRLAEWIVALTVAIQRWTRVPVWRGHVVGAEPNRLLLAVPWYSEPVVRGALNFATQLVGLLSQPVPDRTAVDDVVAYLRRSIPPAQSLGLFPWSLRYIQAALDRDIPFDVLPGCVQLGWGARSDRIDGSQTSGSGFIATMITGDHLGTRRLLGSAGIPMLPRGDVVGDIGDDHRLLVVRGGLIAAARRTGAETAEEVTAVVHPANRRLVERAARIVGLDVVGVDLLIPDISRSWREVGGAICELHARPDLEPHWQADPDRDINGEVLDALHGRRSWRIPTTVVAGADASLTAAVLHRIWLRAGVYAGLCTQSALLVGTEVVSSDNLAGHPGGRVLLGDPGVEAAVLEMPRQRVIEAGHPCDFYDVAALLDTGDAHPGPDAEVLERARRAIVVNADDALCMRARGRAGTDRHILVSRFPESVAAHWHSGGQAVFIDDRTGAPWIMLASGDTANGLMPVHEVRVNEAVAMFAAAMAWAHGIDTHTIRDTLASSGDDLEWSP